MNKHRRLEILEAKTPTQEIIFETTTLQEIQKKVRNIPLSKEPFSLTRIQKMISGRTR